MEASTGFSYNQPRDPLKFLSDFPQVWVADVDGDGREEVLLLDKEILRFYSR